VAALLKETTRKEEQGKELSRQDTRLREKQERLKRSTPRWEATQRTALQAGLWGLHQRVIQGSSSSLSSMNLRKQLRGIVAAPLFKAIAEKVLPYLNVHPKGRSL